MEIVKIDVDKLELWDDNARYGQKALNERECLNKIYGDEKLRRKTLKLLDAILEKKEIQETFIVYESNTLFDKKYIALDGNRRLSLFKLKKYPDLIRKYKIDASKIELLDSIIKEINCTLYYDIDLAYDQVENRHLGEQEGKGIVPWDAPNKDRMKKIRNKEEEISIGTKIMDFYKNTNNPKYRKVKENIKDKSTLDRIFKSSAVKKDIFDLKKESEYNLNNPIVVDKVDEMLNLFYSTKGDVTEVYKKDQIMDMFKDIEPLTKQRQTRTILKNNVLLPPQNENIVLPDNKNESKIYNHYKSKESVRLFNWKSEGLRIESKEFNYYLENSINIYGNKEIDEIDFSVLLIPYLYRILLDCAFQTFYNFINNNNQVFINNEAIIEFLNNYKDNHSLATEKNIVMLFKLKGDISKHQEEYKLAKSSMSILNKLSFNQNNSNNIHLYVTNINLIIHGKKTQLGLKELKGLDFKTLQLLKIISSLINKNI